jgi:hypothetical protein
VSHDLDIADASCGREQHLLALFELGVNSHS